MGFILDQYGQIQFDEAGRPLVDELNDGLLVYPDVQPHIETTVRLSCH